MKLRIAKKIALARNCGFDCHRWGTVTAAFKRFSRGMRTRRSRLLRRWFPEMTWWSRKDLLACGALQPLAVRQHRAELREWEATLMDGIED